MVASARGSFVTGQITWERGLWMKQWSYIAVGHSLRGLFSPGTTVFKWYIWAVVNISVRTAFYIYIN